MINKYKEFDVLKDNEKLTIDVLAQLIYYWGNKLDKTLGEKLDLLAEVNGWANHDIRFFFFYGK